MIGIPVISSLNIFTLWCRLCDIKRDKIALTPSEDTLEFWEQWNEEFVLKVVTSPNDLIVYMACS